MLCSAREYKILLSCRGLKSIEGLDDILDLLLLALLLINQLNVSDLVELLVLFQALHLGALPGDGLDLGVIDFGLLSWFVLLFILALSGGLVASCALLALCSLLGGLLLLLEHLDVFVLDLEEVLRAGYSTVLSMFGTNKDSFTLSSLSMSSSLLFRPVT